MSDNTNQESTGCMKFAGIGCGALVVVFAALITIGLLADDREESDGPREMVFVTGTVRLSAAQCDFRQEVRILPDGGKPVILRMDGDAYRPGEPCRLRIDTLVERASSYTIDVRGVGEETYPHRMVSQDANGDMTLEVDLAW